MVQRIGNDIIEIARIRENLARYGQKFLDRIFTLEEQEYCARFKDQASHLAVRFAAKEAVSKALGTGIGQKLSWLDISIQNDEYGSPIACLSLKASALFEKPRILISLSHCRDYASAVAILI